MNNAHALCRPDQWFITSTEILDPFANLKSKGGLHFPSLLVFTASLLCVGRIRVLLINNRIWQNS